MSARDDILTLLKQSAPMTAADVGRATGLTSMGARGHLERLERDGLVRWHDQAAGRGRPRRLWRLTGTGHKHFPDRHDNLTADLLLHIRTLFGDDGLDRLIGEREQQQRERYGERLAGVDSAEEKLRALAEERSREGYMAEVIATDAGDWELIEHHCPICAAAETCQNFCRSELAVFRDALGPEYRVERDEHLMQDGQRCRYRIQLREPE